MGNSLLVAIAKDEAADVFEWALFHSLIGFQRTIVYDNGSTDGTLREIARAARFCDVTAVDWPGRGRQLDAYNDALARYGPKFDHICFLDIDEFLFLYRHERVGRFLASLKDPAVAISWRMFGSSGHVARPAGYVLEQYRRCAHDDISTNRHVKSVLRTRGLEALPHMLTPHNAGGPYADAAGDPVAWISSKPLGGKARRLCAPEIARVHHYHTKSLQDYRDKVARGNATSGKPRPDCFIEYDRNEEAAPQLSRFHLKVIDRIREADRASRASEVKTAGAATPAAGRPEP